VNNAKTAAARSHDTPSPAGTASVRARAGAIAFAAALSLYVSTAGGSLTSTDAVVTFDLTKNLVERHSLALSGNLLGLEANRGVDGRYYSQYGLGQSIYGIPFYLAGKVLPARLGLSVGSPETLPKAFVALGSAVAAAGCAALVLLLAWEVSGSSAGAWVAFLASAVASPLWPYSSFGFNAPLAACLLLAAAWSAWRAVNGDRPWLLALSGTVFGLLWLTRHEMALLLGPFVWWLGLEARGRHRPLAGWLVRFLPGVVSGGALWMLYNWRRFGNPFDVGYAPTFAGLGYAGFMVSPAASLWLYWPAAFAALAGLVWLARRDRATPVLLAGPVVVLLGFFGSLEDWAGGRSYGPRYLVPAIPLCAVAIAPLAVARARARRLILAMLAISTVIQIPAVLVDYSRVSQSWAAQASVQEIRDRLWLWRAAPLVLTARQAVASVPRNLAYLIGREPPPVVKAEGSSERGHLSRQFTFSLDLWWLYLFYLGVLSPPVALAAGGGAMLLAGLLGWRLRRMLLAVGDGPPLRRVARRATG
jgi:hypothetical protein